MAMEHENESGTEHNRKAKPSGKPARSFSRHLAFRLSLVIMAAFLVSGSISYLIHVRLFTDEVSKQFAKANEQAASRLDLQIRDIYRISNFVVFHPYVQGVLKRSAAVVNREAFMKIYDQNELEKLLMQVKFDENKLYTMYLFDTEDNGFYFTTSNTAPTLLRSDIYDEVKTRLESTMGNLIWFPAQILEQGSDQLRNVYVAARYMKDLTQVKYGIMVMLFEESLFSEDLNELARDEKANVFLYDRLDRLVYTDMKDGETVPDPSKIETDMTETAGGISYVYVKSQSKQVDYTLISRVSLDELKSRSSIIFQANIAIGLLGAAVASVLVMLTGNRLLRPLRQLVTAMRRMRAGNFDTRIGIRTNDELGFISESFNDMARNIKSLIQEVYERQLNEREAELTALQAQLNPHFLHNTLDTIYWKTYLQEDKETAKLVVSLSDMLRYALEPVDKHTTLREEMTQTRNYLMIQSSRFGEGLHAMIHADEDILEEPVPRLILQPLAENAFVHGFADKTDGKTLMIRAVRIQLNGKDAIRIEVKDNGKGMAEDEIKTLMAQAMRTSGQAVPSKTADGKRRVPIGLRSVVRRIKLLYGEPYGVTIESKTGGGTCIRVTLPCEGD
ncbi:sensor histidine kinase [Paenibacillus sp. IB182493]|uniref:Sensor histidine kinase n=1 Tax=Paenibacillus arenilitoris TaxID=2772299 RepID=A0A927H440_9BACL|nr:sensor histidine kinase [Paenibacillus arenilitoris]